MIKKVVIFENLIIKISNNWVIIGMSKNGEFVLLNFRNIDSIKLLFSSIIKTVSLSLLSLSNQESLSSSKFL